MLITRDYIVLEGIVARNGARNVFSIVRGSHNTLRRCSGYDANVDANSAVFEASYAEAQYNLLRGLRRRRDRPQDVHVLPEQPQHDAPLLRQLAALGRAQDLGQYWPNGVNLEFYGANECTMENCIAYGRVPAWWSVAVLAQSNTGPCIGNRVLGTIALNAGMNADGKPQTWDVRPGPNAGSTVSHDYRAAGLYLGTGAGKLCRDNVFRDCFCSGSAGAGLMVVGPVEGCVIDHVTLRGNLGAQLDVAPGAGVAVTDCRIEGKRARRARRAPDQSLHRRRPHGRAPLAVAHGGADPAGDGHLRDEADERAARAGYPILSTMSGSPMNRRGISIAAASRPGQLRFIGRPEPASEWHMSAVPGPPSASVVRPTHPSMSAQRLLTHYTTCSVNWPGRAPLRYGYSRTHWRQ